MRTLFGKNRVVLNKAQQNQPPRDVLLQQQSLKARLIHTNQRKHYPNRAALRNQKTYSNITNYVRDPKVKAWVLKEANGQCECCEVDAPFSTAQGEPFLEVHHLRRLADGGSNTVSNAVAVCPNCHREMYFGINKTTLISSIYKVSRLVHE